MSEWTKLLKFAMQYNTEKMTESTQIVRIRKKPLKKSVALSAPSGARTLDPNIKSVVLYQLS